MVKQLLVYAFLVLGLALISTCSGTTYIVGDSSGWDISTDLGSWINGKRFLVGDALMFTYSSSHSLDEVTKESFNGCNTSNVIKAYTNGNTTVTLSKPGERYFVCGNRLHCLGGMKLQVNVESNQSYSPANAPQASSGASDLPQPSSKSNNDVPTSSSYLHNGRESIVLTLFCFISTVGWVV